LNRGMTVPVMAPDPAPLNRGMTVPVIALESDDRDGRAPFIPERASLPH